MVSLILGEKTAVLTIILEEAFGGGPKGGVEKKN